MIVISFMQRNDLFDIESGRPTGDYFVPLTQVAVDPQRFRAMLRTFVSAFAKWESAHPYEGADELKTLLSETVDDAYAQLRQPTR